MEQGNNSKVKKKRKQGKSTVSDRTIKLWLIIVIAIFFVIVFKIFNERVIQQEKLDLSGHSYYQYILGVVDEYSGNINFSEENEQVKLVLEDGRVIYLDSTPLYYKDVIGKAIFPEKMELVIPDKGSYKLDEFSTITEEDNKIYVSKMNKSEKVDLTGAFLYDGDNLYFFLDETKIVIGSEEFIVSPLSYVIVNYKDSVEIYNYDKDEYTMIQDVEELQADVMALNSYRNYRINMSVDSLDTSKSGQLLIKNIKNLPEFEY